MVQRLDGSPAHADVCVLELGDEGLHSAWVAELVQRLGRRAAYRCVLIREPCDEGLGGPGIADAPQRLCCGHAYVPVLIRQPGDKGDHGGATDALKRRDHDAVRSQGGVPQLGDERLYGARIADQAQCLHSRAAHLRVAILQPEDQGLHRPVIANAPEGLGDRPARPHIRVRQARD